MANIAFNIAFVSNYEMEKAQEIIKYFNENFTIVDEPEDNDAEEGYFEIHFDSRWATPKKDLEELAKKFQIEIYGVSYERGMMYVSCWNFRSEKTEDGTLSLQINLHEL